MIRGALALLLAFAAPPAFAQDCAAEIKALAATAFSSGPVQVKSFMNTPNGTIEIRADIAAPDAMRMIIGIPDDPVMEVVSIGKQGWKREEESWIELSPDVAAVLAHGFDANLHRIEIATLTEPECRGPVALRGREVLHYRFHTARNGIATANRLYVDRQTRRATRIESDIAAADGTSWLGVDYEYDPTLTVTAPQ